MTAVAQFEKHGAYTRKLTRQAQESSSEWNHRIIKAINEQRNAGDTHVKLFDGCNHDRIAL